MSNKRVDRLEVGVESPTSPNDEVVWIDADNNTINRYNELSDSWVSVSGSGGGSSSIEGFSFVNNSISVTDAMASDQRITFFPEDFLSISNRNSFNEGSSTTISKQGINISSNAFDASIILDGGENGGEFLNNSNNINNQIATLGDLPSGATGSFTSQDNKTITVTNGIITSIV